MTNPTIDQSLRAVVVRLLRNNAIVILLAVVFSTSNSGCWLNKPVNYKHEDTADHKHEVPCVARSVSVDRSSFYYLCDDGSVWRNILYENCFVRVVDPRHKR